jgi:hypothetical protein
LSVAIHLLPNSCGVCRLDHFGGVKEATAVRFIYGNLDIYMKMMGQINKFCSRRLSIPHKDEIDIETLTQSDDYTVRSIHSEMY